MQQLIDRAEAASARMSARNPHRYLLADLAIACVSLAKLNAELLAEKDQRRIVLP